MTASRPWLWALLAAALAASGCRGTCPCPPGAAAMTPSPAAFDREAEQRAVHAAVLRELRSGEAGVYVVHPAAQRIGGSAGAVRERLPDASSDAVVDALRARTARLPADLSADLPIAWFGDAEWAALPSAPAWDGGRWKAFDERFPKSSGWITLSPVGFSRDGRFAVTHVVRAFGGLSATARLVLLEKVDGAWRVRRTEQTLAA